MRGFEMKPGILSATTSRRRRTDLTLESRPIFVGVLVLVGFLISGATAPPRPIWVGKGQYRLLVRVEPAPLGSRSSDEMPTRIAITPELLHSQLGISGKINVASLEVERYDVNSGQPILYGKWAYAHAGWELPYRWYDGSIPENFPEVVGDINPHTGELNYTPEKNWGYLYETLGEWESGNLAWTHVQERNQPSYYAIYFDLLPPGQTPAVVPRRGFLGDGLERITRIGASTHGLLLSRVEVADWNGDGLPDILVGGERGGIIWYPNRGTRTHPAFPYPKLMFTADGKPLDVGFSATPLVVDWDGDGVQDLVCGVEWNRVVWYKNSGTDAHPRLKYMGLVRTVDGAPLQLLHAPVPETPNIYKTDYHPVLAMADLYGTGRPGLLAGGYVTGRIYYFENLGRDKDHLPRLRFRGPLQADGRPIDVGWAAAPTVGDFEHRGTLDIITGSMYMDPKGGQHGSSKNFLIYYRNIGTPQHPRFTRSPFPLQGKFPKGWVAAPRAADLNGDGLLDLIVAQDTNLSIYMNIGTRTQPRWQFAPPLEGHWNTNPLGWVMQAIDWNHDGFFDLVENFDVRLHQGEGNPQLFSAPRSLLAPGETIFHKSPMGDQWTFTCVVDLDGDGRPDILYGVHQGNVFFHRNLGPGHHPQFDDQGVLLKTKDGRPIKVGPLPGHRWDFDVLQGARTTVTAADFDRDGKVDLMVGDTFGKVRYYRNLTGGSHPVFAAAVLIADAGTRLVPSVADWNGDGWPDVLVGSNKSFIVLNSGRKTGPRFLPQKQLDLPYLPYETTLMAVDWNGDGDTDIMARASYGYLFWFEHSFLEHGYEQARVLAGESR
jgi:FG-GAP-like repeat